MAINLIKKICTHRPRYLLGAGFLALSLGCVPTYISPAHAQTHSPMLTQEDRQRQALPSLREMQELEAHDNFVAAEVGMYAGDDFELELRRDAMREAALSYGMRVGLATRTRQIMNRLQQQDTILDRLFDFSKLLIPAPSAMLIEPPIVSQMQNSFIVNDRGSEAAVSDVIYNISRQARIVAAARNWRQYLTRDWDGEITPPPYVLLPQNSREREVWRRFVRQGWDQGFLQADNIFQADLNRMLNDFEGMVRYRVLVAEGKISEPNAIMEDRGISGTGNVMRIGDRAIRLSGEAQFRQDGTLWQPGIR